MLRLGPTSLESFPTTPDPDPSAKLSPQKWEVCIIQTGGAYATSDHQRFRRRRSAQDIQSLYSFTAAIVL